MEPKYYYYISGTKGMTSSGSFTSNSTRWIIFDEEYVARIGNNKPYNAAKTGIFILTSKFQ